MDLYRLQQLKAEKVFGSGVNCYTSNIENLLAEMRKDKSDPKTEERIKGVVNGI